MIFFIFLHSKSLSIFERLYKEKKYMDNTKKGKGYSGLMGYYRLCKTKQAGFFFLFSIDN